MDLEQSGLRPYEVGQSPTVTTPVTFAYDFVDYGDEASKEAQLCMQMSQVSLSKTYPDAAITQLPHTVSKQHLIPARTQAYAKLRRSVRGNMVFIDCDVIAFRRIDTFSADFDIALTDNDKTWPLMPFNGGMVFAKDTAPAQLFMDRVMEASCDIPAGLPGWWTDQLALRQAYDTLQDRVKIVILPHEFFNYAPDGVQATDAYFVHLKGDRKKYMRQYLAAVLGTDHFNLS